MSQVRERVSPGGEVVLRELERKLYGSAGADDNMRKRLMGLRYTSGDAIHAESLYAAMQDGFRKNYSDTITRVEEAKAEKVPLWYWGTIPLVATIGVLIGVAGFATGYPELQIVSATLVGMWLGLRGTLHASEARARRQPAPDPVAALRERYATTDMSAETYEIELGKLMGLAYTDGEETDEP